MQANRDRPCIEAMVSHILGMKKTNYSARVIMSSLPKMLEFDFPLKSLDIYFQDPDYEDSSDRWPIHFLNTTGGLSSSLSQENF